MIGEHGRPARQVQRVRDKTETSPAGTAVGEFFGVATETFFTRPVELAGRKPELYELFAAFYRQEAVRRTRDYIERFAGAGAVAVGRPRIVARRLPESRVRPRGGVEGPST